MSAVIVAMFDSSLPQLVLLGVDVLFMLFVFI
jgi:hypothetical protein